MNFTLLNCSYFILKSLMFTIRPLGRRWSEEKINFVFPISVLSLALPLSSPSPSLSHYVYCNLQAPCSLLKRKRREGKGWLLFFSLHFSILNQLYHHSPIKIATLLNNISPRTR
uniref:Uncharacterized protein n=1 Tax=Manihot esculenta TaxID=3983 RepID=A0A2C9VGZ0_MANES